jgi:hypothetical protein
VSRLLGIKVSEKEKDMPLLPGKKNVGKNISELHGGKTHAATQAKSGKAAADRQSIAIALDKARRSGAKIPKK